MRVAVALDHLCGDAGRPQSQLRERLLFDLRRQVCKCPDSSRKFPDAHRFGSFLKSALLPAHFVIPERQLQPEGCRLRMDSVSAPDGDSRLEFMSALLQDVEQSRDTRGNELRSVDHLKGHGRIEYVRRGQSEVKVSVQPDRRTLQQMS